MIKKVLGWMIRPGVMPTSEYLNPLKSSIDLLKVNKEARKQLKVEDHRIKKMKSISDAEVAHQLYKQDLKKYRVSSSKEQNHYHIKVVYGGLFLLIGALSVIMPILQILNVVKINIPVLSSLIPAYGVLSIVAVMPIAGCLLIVGLKNWYLAKMIILKQRFSFTQYLKSFAIVPNRSKVIK